MTLKSKFVKKFKINFLIFIQKYTLPIYDQLSIVQQPLENNEKCIKIPVLVINHIIYNLTRYFLNSRDCSIILFILLYFIRITL